MEHVFATQCRRFVPNQYVLVQVAARRARQLQRGEAPRINLNGTLSPPLLALAEIAGGAFTDAEIEALIAPPVRQAQDEPPALERMSADEAELLDGMAMIAAESSKRDYID